MARLPDPTENLTGADLEAFNHMASARAHADGRAQLGDVYVNMFNNPGVATKVGALGEHLRFHGVLPDAMRELVILRFAVRQGLAYEWSHHQRPAKLAGLSDDVIAGLTAGDVPESLPDASQAALEIVDMVVACKSIPADLQARFVAAHGEAGIVEIVVLCGLYATMGFMTAAFDIAVEGGFPKAPF